MNTHWNRRRFVTTVLVLPATVSVAGTPKTAAAQPVQPAFAPALPEDVVPILRRVSYLLFPFPDVGAGPYDRTVAAVEQLAAGNPDTMSLIVDGAHRLRDAQGAAWLSLDADEQTAALAAAEQTPFFRFLLGTTRNQLFNDPAIWAHIGYEGSSLEHGGYVDRGLDDIDWLDDR